MREPRSQRNTTPEMWRREEQVPTSVNNKRRKGKSGLTFKVYSKIEQRKNFKCEMEERALDICIEFSLQEILGILKREFQDVIIDLMKRKRHLTKMDGTKPIRVNLVTMDGFKAKEDYVDGH